MATTEVYKTKYPVRFVTASSLFDGHDASVNIMRRILQSSGAEVIHLGHNRSVEEVVNAAIQEDAQGIALSSYQGGHMEYFKYMYDLLNERNAGHIKIYGGGGGVILALRLGNLDLAGGVCAAGFLVIAEHIVRLNAEGVCVACGELVGDEVVPLGRVEVLEVAVAVSDIDVVACSVGVVVPAQVNSRRLACRDEVGRRAHSADELDRPAL